MTFTSRKPKSWGPYPALYQAMYVCCTARVQEHVALADARLGLQQPGLEQRLADGLGQLAVVARETACEVGELRVVATPLPHAVEPLQDAPCDAPRGVRVVVGPRRLLAGGVDQLLLELLDGFRPGRHPAQRRDPRGGAQRVAVPDRLAQVVRGKIWHGERPCAEAIDPCQLLLEGERDELG